MNDRLTQLQDAVDQLAVQFYSALHYLSSHHDFVPLGDDQKVSDAQWTADDPAVFEATKNELARDIMIRTRQIDLLIDSLPGAGVSETDQLARVERLKEELIEADQEQKKWLEERDMLLAKCDSVVLQLSRAKNEIDTTTELP
ncbi:mediator complex, subunit Med21 [Lipomyces oligophaga]|uniref:mediator complex, subunit Med21 n=1 Tax=Lipomyces oligophaga TaxID=45792 RepID=UPI0034CFB891